MTDCSRISRFTAWLAAAMLLASPGAWAGAVEDWPPAPAPETSTLTVVAEDMRFNGVDMRSYELLSEEPRERVAAYYRRLWAGRDGEPAFSEDKLGPWLILGHEQDGYFLSVQLEIAGRGSRGLVGITRLPRPGTLPHYGEEFPKPAGTTVLNDIHSTDAGKRGRTLVLENRMSVDANLEFYQRHYRRQGWIAQELPPPSGGVAALMMHKNSRQFSATFSHSQDKTHIIVVITEV